MEEVSTLTSGSIEGIGRWSRLKCRSVIIEMGASDLLNNGNVQQELEMEAPNRGNRN